MPLSCSISEAERRETKLDSAAKCRSTRPAELSGHSYLYVAMFTIVAQAAGLIAAYTLGFAYHYNSLIKSHCSVSTRLHVRKTPLFSCWGA